MGPRSGELRLALVAALALAGCFSHTPVVDVDAGADADVPDVGPPHDADVEDAAVDGGTLLDAGPSPDDGGADDGGPEDAAAPDGSTDADAGEPRCTFVDFESKTTLDCPPGSNIIVGTDGDDVLYGTEGDDCIVACGGDDVI